MLQINIEMNQIYDYTFELKNIWKFEKTQYLTKS